MRYAAEDDRRRAGRSARESYALGRVQRRRAGRGVDCGSRQARPVRHGQDQARSRAVAAPAVLHLRDPARGRRHAAGHQHPEQAHRHRYGPALRRPRRRPPRPASVRSGNPGRSSTRRPRRGWWPGAWASRRLPRSPRRSRRAVSRCASSTARDGARISTTPTGSPSAVSTSCWRPKTAAAARTGESRVPLDAALRDTRRRRADRDLLLRADADDAGRRANAPPAAGRDAWVSLEQVMGCGMGGCYSCVVPVKTPEGRPHFVRSCTSGPVFAASTLQWEGLAHHG